MIGTIPCDETSSVCCITKLHPSKTSIQIKWNLYDVIKLLKISVLKTSFPQKVMKPYFVTLQSFIVANNHCYHFCNCVAIGLVAICWTGLCQIYSLRTVPKLLFCIMSLYIIIQKSLPFLTGSNELTLDTPRYLLNDFENHLISEFFFEIITENIEKSYINLFSQHSNSWWSDVIKGQIICQYLTCWILWRQAKIWTNDGHFVDVYMRYICVTWLKCYLPIYLLTPTQQEKAEDLSSSP